MTTRRSRDLTPEPDGTPPAPPARTRGTPGDAAPLRVSVTHGDLGAVQEAPIFIGAYDGTPIKGPGDVLDRRLRGALRRRLALGQYPGALGTCDVIRDAAGTPAVVVIGIGHSGELTPGQLGAGVTQGVLELAARRLDSEALPDRGMTTMTIASVMIGTSGAGSLPQLTAVTAIVNGVRRANARLHDVGAMARVEHLRFVEVYEDRAIQALHAIARLPQDLGSEHLQVDPRLDVGCGGRPGMPPPEYQDDQWRTVRVVAAPGASRAKDGLVALSFTNVGRSAGAEQSLTTGQRALVDRLVASAVQNPEVDPQLYNTLYELLVPVTLKGQGKVTENVMYVLDEHAATLPLEMLATRSFDDGIVPLATEVGVVRRLETPAFRANVRVATGMTALVIGDPPTSRYPALPGAATEACRVADVLRSCGFEVKLIVPSADRELDTAERIVNALFAREYRIVHIAAHGQYDARHPARSGVVIGDDVFLTALEIQQMQTSPELVFLNCCHLGTLIQPPGSPGDPSLPGWRPDRLASSIARGLVEIGVRAVVAAGWAVDDSAAEDFAACFYEEMLRDGSDIGSASRDARRFVYDKHPSVNSWGAYQVYAPPVFRLSPSARARPRQHDATSPRELRDELQRLRRAAGDASHPAELAGIRRQLTDLLDGVDDVDWVGGSEYDVAGQILADLGEYGAAVDMYERARNDWGAGAPLKLFEQLANVRVKWAADCALAQDDRCTDLFDAARDAIDRLGLFGDTPERLSLLGSYWRRRAQCAGTDAERRACVTEAAGAYQRADDLRMQVRKQHDYYAGINAAVLGWMAAQASPRGAPDAEGGGGTAGRGTFDVTDALARVEACRLVAEQQRCTDFWSRVTAGDAALAGHLLRGDLVAGTDAVEAAYLDAFLARSSQRERMSVVEHVGILRDLIPDDDAGRPTRDALARLRARLLAWPDEAPAPG